MLMVLVFDNGILSNPLKQHPIMTFPGFASSKLDYFGICVIPSIFYFITHEGGQHFSYELKYPHDASITPYARHTIVDNTLMLISILG